MKKLSLAGLLSPVSLLVVAALLTIGYAVCHTAGWREHVGVISGTYSTTAGSIEWQILKATAYAGLYFAVVLLVPVLVLASLLQVLVLRLFSRPYPRASGRLDRVSAGGPVGPTDRHRPDADADSPAPGRETSAHCGRGEVYTGL